MHYPLKDYLLPPNLLSLLRILLAVPMFLFFMQPVPPLTATLLCSIVIILSDLLDGIIARRFNMSSELGRILDPLGDKVIMFAAMSALLIAGRLTLPLLILLAGKDLLIFSGGMIIVKRTGEVIPSNFFGKWASALLGCGFLCFILLPSIAAAGNSGVYKLMQWGALLLLAGGTLFVFLSLAGYSDVLIKKIRNTPQNSCALLTALFTAAAVGWVLFTLFHYLQVFVPQLIGLQLL